jgi:2'-aminobiphenyl-2,3-diol 1,2-dioxygenase small subunit
MARYVVHQLIQNLFKEPGLLDRLNSAPDAVYDTYGLTVTEREAISEASPAALAAIGVHPILQMHLMLARNPRMAEMISVKSYTAEWGLS